MLDRIGKYRVIREIGKGATATVYLCKADDIEELVAVKLVDFGDKNRDQGKWSRRMRKLFLTEAAIAAKLNHPNIIRIFDAQVEEGRAYLVMEYIEGEALDHYCEFNKMLPLPRAVSIVFKCCMALDYAFKQGVVHRDIKPANILISAGHALVADFGIARAMEGDGHSVTSCSTAEGALVLDAQQTFDLVVSDASLPGISGTELARRLLAVDPQRWVVLCSGYELGSYPTSWGPNVRTLLKPFELDELDQLLGSIREAVARPGA